MESGYRVRSLASPLLLQDYRRTYTAPLWQVRFTPHSASYRILDPSDLPASDLPLATKPPSHSILRPSAEEVATELVEKRSKADSKAFKFLGPLVFCLRFPEASMQDLVARVLGTSLWLVVVCIANRSN